MNHFLVLFLLLTASVQAQLESSVWYFGNNAGISFLTNLPTSLNDGMLNTSEGCATIANASGELLFYTDGKTIWNKNHLPMPNGEGLLGHESSTQSAVIVPFPNNNFLDYVITVDFLTGASDGFRYHLVDMSLDNGLGDITIKNELLESSSLEKVTVVLHENGIDYWVIGHRWENNTFFSYLISESGINSSPIISQVGSVHNGEFANGVGYLKSSPNGKKIALANSFNDNFVEILDFDAATGVLSNPIRIDDIFLESFNILGPYGIEFSPDSTLMYVSDVDPGNNYSRIHQFDLTSNTLTDILATDTIVYEGNETLGALQLGIDSKIYVAVGNASYLATINLPNSQGLACDFNLQQINLLNRTSSFGLPPLIESNFDAQLYSFCDGSNTRFSVISNKPVSNIIWDFGDGNNSTGNDVSHYYDNYGSYTVTATVTSGIQTRVLIASVESCTLVIPEGFSPNNDNINDWFNIKGLYNIFEKHELKIYNRYGVQVFEGDNSNRFFGISNLKTTSNQLLPSGTYYYVLLLNDERYPNPISGWVYINY